MKNLKDKAIFGVQWIALATVIKAILQLVQLLVLARFLSAEDFGIVAIIMVVIGFSQLFMDMGISNAIIYKNSITDIQLSSLYWLNIFSGTLLTIIIFLVAPLIAAFYEEDAITSLLELLSFSFLINAIGNQYRVLLKKNLEFKILAKVEISSGLVSFIFAIILSIQGFGAYSIILATLMNIIVLNIVFLIIGIKLHKPKFTYKHQEIKSFLTFGLYQMGQNSIIYFNNQLDVIIIGKLLGTEVLGIYSLTKQIVMRPSQIINPIVTGVTFPIMSQVQNNLIKLKLIYLKIINSLSSVNFPIYILMVILADSIVPLFFGQKWINIVEIFQILSLYALIRSTTSPAGSLLLSQGRADIGFWWSISEFIVMPFVLYIGSYWGIIGISIGLLIFQIIFLFPNWYFIVRKICNASFLEYFSVQGQPLLAVLLSVSTIHFILFSLELNNLSRVISYITLMIIIYIFFSYWLNKSFLREIKNIFIKKVKI